MEVIITEIVYKNRLKNLFFQSTSDYCHLNYAILVTFNTSATFYFLFYLNPHQQLQIIDL